MKNQTCCLHKVDQMRQELQRCGMKNGFTHEKTVRISEQLDHIITNYTRKQLAKSPKQYK